MAFSKPEEPSFLREFKAKVGYREPATVGRFTECPFVVGRYST